MRLLRVGTVTECVSHREEYMLRSVKYLCGVAFGLAVAAAGSAGAADFYRGKTLSTVISGAAGGNTNLQARTLMRFMKKHIPGKPRIVNRNMAGSGGLLATNFVGEVAPRDGTTIWVGTVSYLYVDNSLPMIAYLKTAQCRHSRPS